MLICLSHSHVRSLACFAIELLQPSNIERLFFFFFFLQKPLTSSHATILKWHLGQDFHFKTLNLFSLSLLDLLSCLELLSYCMTHLHFSFNWWIDGLMLLLGLSNIKHNFCFLQWWQVLRHQIIFKPCCCTTLSLLDSYYCVFSFRQIHWHPCCPKSSTLGLSAQRPLKILSHKTLEIWKSILMFLPMWK